MVRGKIRVRKKDEEGGLEKGEIKKVMRSLKEKKVAGRDGMLGDV